MPKEIPIQTTEDNLRTGAKVYIQQCSACHGQPEEPRPAIAAAMFPPPSQLDTKEEGVTDDPPAETYWKIQNGIRLSNPKDVVLPQGASAFNSGILDPGQTNQRTFEKPGTYQYVCTLHEAQRMIGEVIVKP